MLDKDRLEIFQTASTCRMFEERLYKEIENKRFSYPVYLSAGQEFISATLAYHYKALKPLIFAQHRAHSTYLSFGGTPESLIQKLLYSKEGSASISNEEINMFGHDGLMGTQAPIGVGACFSSSKFTIVILGDASVEEDYVMSSIAWAGTKKLPILFVVEDNNLSILTEKKVRRNWNIHEFARSVKVQAYNLSDSPEDISNVIKFCKIGYEPVLLNINTTRLFYHANAGIDEGIKQDRYKLEKEILKEYGSYSIELNTQSYIKSLWDNALKDYDSKR